MYAKLSDLIPFALRSCRTMRHGREWLSSRYPARCQVCALFLAAIISASLSGCGGSTPDESALHSSDPTKKIQAIIESGREKDASAVPYLIELLGNDDPVVRMVTIEALERITGDRKGYVPYATPLEREASIKNWIKAYEDSRQN